MRKALYQNTIFKLGIGIANSFSGMTLNMFWKRALHILIYIYIYIYNKHASSVIQISSIPYQNCMEEYYLYFNYTNVKLFKVYLFLKFQYRHETTI